MKHLSTHRTFISCSYVLLFLFGLTVTVTAQTETSDKPPERFSRMALEKRAIELGIPIRMENEMSKATLIGFHENGMPLYYATTNVVAAATISTNKLYPGGSAGLSLTGNGVRIGEWDGGAVLATHQEFGGRVTQKDSPSSVHYHATHVAGTLIGAGAYAPARGMAYAATLHAYDWDDDVTEMDAAARNGLQVSNHSYGVVTGWYNNSGTWYWFGDVTISTTIDASFGYYSTTTRNWDIVARNNPKYLIVKSAGNDRGEGPAPGTGHYYWDPGTGNWAWSTDTRTYDGGTTGFDCVTDAGTAKNILTVGAVNDISGGYASPSNVVMTSFSAWGPTDDGRIKPDIVANGDGLTSAFTPDDNSYASTSGTSMAAPSVAGSIALLLQHQNNLHSGDTLLASTVKALVIHTADEAGSATGPDYTFGWGLMNTAKAAKVMTDNAASGSPGHIEEYLLNYNGSYQKTIRSDGSPIRVTIAWTDPAATLLPLALNNRSPRLVNDLDLRITGPGSTTYYPYRLDPDNPAQSATTGDNIRDNVEMIYIAAPVNGEVYTVKVTHKGTLTGGAQTVSIIMTGNLIPLNLPPIANAGNDKTISCLLPTGVAVNLNGSGSYDPDNDQLTYTWREGSTIIAGPSTNAISNVHLPLGFHVITLTVDDGKGGTDTDTVIVHLIGDTTPPTITPPADLVLDNDPGVCGRNLSNTTLGKPFVSDYCSVPNYSHNAPAVFPVGVTNVTWTASDASGNTSTAIQKVTIRETELPTITAPADLVLENDPGQCGRNLSNTKLGTPVVSDNCPGVGYSHNAPAYFPVGVTNVTWTAEDASGNTKTAVQKVTIRETELPTIKAPAEIVLENDPGVCGRYLSNTKLGTPVVSDNCPGVGYSNDAPAVLPIGVTKVVWTAKDASGNTQTAVQLVTIRDTELPAIKPPVNLVLGNDPGQCGKYLANISLGTPVVTDNCPGTTYAHDAPSLFPIGVTSVKWTARDANGNLSTATQLVTINDTQPPTISTLAPVTANNDANVCGRAKVNTALGLPTATDNCGKVSVTNNAPAVFPVGITTVTWTATDGSNNTATSTQLVTILDVQPPKITAPAAVSLSNDPGECGKSTTNIALGNPVASDNCVVASVVNDAPGFFPVGTTIVTWTARDASGNTATAKQNVVIRDTEKPSIAAPLTVTVDAGSTMCGRTSGFALGSATATDNCGKVTVTNDAPSFFPVGTTTVTWRATDNSGNYNTATQQITVRDVTPPVITPLVFPQSLTPANGTMRTVMVNVMLSDNCPGSSFVLSSVTSSEPDAGTGPGDLPGDIVAAINQPATQIALRAERAPNSFGRTYTIRYTAKDASNNHATATRYVYVAASIFLKDNEIVFTDEAVVPQSPSLEQNYPNPFSATTSLIFRLPEEKAVTLTVYDALGRETARLADGIFSPGSHAVIFDANNLPDGVYYARLSYGDQVLQTKMILVRQ